MTTRRSKAAGLIFGAAALALSAGSANAAVIVETLPEFSSPSTIGPFPGPTLNLGTFNFGIPAGETIISAFLEGQFGNSVSASSASHQVFADGTQVAQCGFSTSTDAPCNTSIVPWSFSFTDFSDLLDGSLDITVVQIRFGAIQQSGMRLTITTQATAAPEPGALALFGLSLAGIGFAARRKRKAG